MAELYSAAGAKPGTCRGPAAFGLRKRFARQHGELVTDPKPLSRQERVRVREKTELKSSRLGTPFRDRHYGTERNRSC